MRFACECRSQTSIDVLRLVKVIKVLVQLQKTHCGDEEQSLVARMCANQGCGAEIRAWNFSAGSIALICGASELTKQKVFQFSLDEVSFELEPQTLDAWSRSLKFEFGSTALVPTHLITIVAS